MISTWHAHIASNELRKKSEIETDEDYQRREPPPSFRIHATADLWPPIVKTSKVCEKSSTYHDVVQVTDYEIGIMHVHIQSNRRQKKSSHATDRKQPNE